MEKTRMSFESAKTLLTGCICHTIFRSNHISISIWFEKDKEVARTLGVYEDFRVIVAETEFSGRACFAGEEAGKLNLLGRLRLVTDLHSD